MQKFSNSHWLGVLLVSALLAGLAWAETLEMVTYYPAPAAAGGNFDRLHANRAMIGDAYNRTNVPDAQVPDGHLFVFDRLGVGTTTPAGPLHVVGVDDADSSVAFVPGVDTAPLGDTDMRVGIGTVTPGAELDIYAPADAVFARLWGASDGDNFSGLELRSEQGALGPAGDRIWQLAHKQGGGAGEANDFHLSYNDGTGWFQRLVVNAAGDVGIGTMFPQTRLDVAGSIRFSLPGQDNGGLLYAKQPGNFGGRETVLTVADGAGGPNEEIWIGPNTGDYQGHIQLVAADILFNSSAVSASRLINNNLGVGTMIPRTPAPNGQAAGNLDVNDIWLRAANAGAGAWMSASAGGGGIFNGSYDGNGSAGPRAIAVPFQPQAVLMMESNIPPQPTSGNVVDCIWKTSNMPAGLYINSWNDWISGVLTFTPTGFNVGGNETNRSGRRYFYTAFR